MTWTKFNQGTSTMFLAHCQTLNQGTLKVIVPNWSIYFFQAELNESHADVSIPTPVHLRQYLNEYSHLAAYFSPAAAAAAAAAVAAAAAAASSSAHGTSGELPSPSEDVPISMGNFGSMLSLHKQHPSLFLPNGEIFVIGWKCKFYEYVGFVIGMSFSSFFSAESGKQCRRRKARTVFSDAQLCGLERRFEAQRYLSTPERVELATALNLSETQVSLALIKILKCTTSRQTYSGF